MEEITIWKVLPLIYIYDRTSVENKAKISSIVSIPVRDQMVES